MSGTFRIVEHVVPAQHIREYARATAHSQEEELQLAVKQYVPLDNPNPQPGDVTILGAHANGFPKEMYEALWEDLHAKSKEKGFRIRGIWIADVAWQGQSGLLNGSRLGNDPSWFDHARDLLHMVNHFRASMPRPIVGVGHSFGGNILVNVSLMHPRLMHSLVLLDPVISRFASTPTGPEASPAASSYGRRDIWPSREEAVKSFKKSKFYGSWDHRVLNAWCNFGVKETPTLVYPDKGKNGEVTLTTSKHQEIFTFFRPSWPAYDKEGKEIIRPEMAPDMVSAESPQIVYYPFYRPEGALTYEKLPFVRPSVLYVFGETSEVSPPQLCQQKLDTTGTGVGGSGGAAKGRVKGVILKGIGHLVAMNVPGVCADHAADWLDNEMARWRKEEQEWEEWKAKSDREKTLLTEEWGEKLGRKKKEEAKL
ncbi:Abhydrolase domain-containing protein [Zalerion maritima]|uniref:Abhydrolase domain-containing protein n=1 Tax=Zalerion maritima TaxID=339359 RepID=A0AAD5RVM4_9PEZI|nr:Abhydrolase domain-containing protein [Zalerion maritima]